MKRHKHGLSHYRLLTADMGKLYPIACFEALPGDTIQQSTSLLLRMSPLIAPVMHPVQVRVHHFFVPNRLLWDGWEAFITGGQDGLGDGVGTPPTITGTVTKGSLHDHLGMPVTSTPVTFSALPFLAFRKIYFDWFYDQDAGDWDPEQYPGTADFPVPVVGWEKDYFTTSRPWPQKGPDVFLPVGGEASLVVGSSPPKFKSSDNQTHGNVLQMNGDSNTNWSAPNLGGPGPTMALWEDPQLSVDLASATGVNVNDLRRAMAIQRYQEARARYGSRYTEYLAYLGIRSSDARLQRSEYLGGGRQTVTFSEVLQTAPGFTEGAPVGSQTGVGTMAGHGISAMRSNRYRRFFEEHGIVLSLLSVRPRTMYVQGQNRMWSRTTKEDYWQRELEQIGQQPVLSKEVHYAGGDTVFGYQDRYSEYKQIPSKVSGDFVDTLNYWHLAREFSQPPVWNAAFLSCDPSKRIFQEQTTDSMWMMAYHSIQARRMVRASGSARII